MKLMLYVDPSWRRPLPHAPLLFPFWGNALTDKTPYQKALFERHSFTTKHYDITEDPGSADIVCMPYRYAVALKHAPELVALCHKKARMLGLPLLIDATGDIEYEINLDRTFALRFGGYRFSKKPSDIIVPQYADDLLEAAGKKHISIREKQLRPVIAFTGWASQTPEQRVRTILKEIPVLIHGLLDSKYVAQRKGIYFRRRALGAIERSPSVRSNIIVRSAYSGHSATAEKSADELRAEYIENLCESDYGLDVRGDSNSSQRLFEILSLGRIPVIIDTERNLPFSDRLDYSAFSCIVDFRELDLLPMRLAHFHAALSAEAFIQMQKEARHAFRHFFRADVLIEHVLRELRARMITQTT